jgi:hypothetical protein
LFNISGKIRKDSGTLRDQLKKSGIGGKKDGISGKVTRKMANSLQSFGIQMKPIRAISYNALAEFCANVVNGIISVLVGLN